jgi:hypothetical protein
MYAIYITGTQRQRVANLQSWSAGRGVLFALPPPEHGLSSSELHFWRIQRTCFVVIIIPDSRGRYPQIFLSRQILGSAKWSCSRAQTHSAVPRPSPFDSRGDCGFGEYNGGISTQSALQSNLVFGALIPQHLETPAIPPTIYRRRRL